MFHAEGIKGIVDEIFPRHGMGDVFESVHALIMLYAVSLHLADEVGFDFIHLSSDDSGGAFENGLDDG